MFVDELKTHIVSSVCVLFVLFYPLVFKRNIFWILSVLVLMSLLALRSLMGEISLSAEKIFIALNVAVVIIFIIASALN